MNIITEVDPQTGRIKVYVPMWVFVSGVAFSTILSCVLMAFFG